MAVGDLLSVINTWGACVPKMPCPADLNGNGVVDVVDLLIILQNWS